MAAVADLGGREEKAILSGYTHIVSHPPLALRRHVSVAQSYECGNPRSGPVTTVCGKERAFLPPEVNVSKLKESKRVL